MTDHGVMNSLVPVFFPGLAREFPLILREYMELPDQRHLDLLICLVHDPLYLWSDDFPAMPRPYETIDAAHSYGPEGHPNYRKEAAE